jgi:hypothetical protein
MNNLIKRVAFGLVNFRHHRVRSLLYAGKPNWDLLPTITPAEIRRARYPRWRRRLSEAAVIGFVNLI